MNLGRDATKGALWSLTSSVVAQALTFLVFILIARHMDPNAYGLVALSMAFIMVLIAISDLGLKKLLVQIQVLGDTELDTAFYLSATLGALLALCFWLLAPLIARAFAAPELLAVMRWTATVIVLKALEVVPRGVMIRQFKFRAIAFSNMAAIAAGGLVGVLMALEGYGVWALVGQEITRAGVSLLAIWMSSRWRAGNAFSLEAVRAMLQTSTQIMGTELTKITNQHLDRVLIGGFFGITTLGIYTIASKVQRIATEVSLVSLSAVGLPTFARARSDPVLLRNVYYLSQRIAAAATLPIFVLLIITAESLIPLLLGPQWTDSAPILQVLMLTSCALSVSAFNSPLLISVGRADIVFRLGLFNMAADLIAFLIAFKWGIMTVAWAFALRAWLVLPLDFALCQRFASIPILPIRSGLMSQLSALAAMIVAMMLFRSTGMPFDPWLLLLMELSIGLGSYLAVLALLDRKLIRLALQLPTVLRSGERHLR